MDGMDWREADLCQYGLVTPGPAPLRVAMPAKKPTRFASNSWCVLEEACRRCSGEHRHQSLMGGRAAAAAEYTPELCEAFCRGLARQKRYDQQQMATSRRHGRSELKALIRRLTENVKRDATCAEKPKYTNPILLTAVSGAGGRGRAEKYRENRRVRAMVCDHTGLHPNTSRGK